MAGLCVQPVHRMPSHQRDSAVPHGSEYQAACTVIGTPPPNRRASAALHGGPDKGAGQVQAYCDSTSNVAG
jgi:hypothetical protein